MRMAILAFLLIGLAEDTLAAPYVELSYTDYRHNYSARNLYVDQAINSRDSVSLNVYKDAEYESIYVGVARSFGNALLGLSVGEAIIYGKPTVGYNPWILYDDEGWEGYAEYEYLNDAKDDWYYRAYLHAELTRHLFMGVYSERDVGTGPSLGLQFGRAELGFKAWIVKPTIDDRDVPAVLNFSVWMEF